MALWNNFQTPGSFVEDDELSFLANDPPDATTEPRKLLIDNFPEICFRAVRVTKRNRSLIIGHARLANCKN